MINRRGFLVRMAAITSSAYWLPAASILLPHATQQPARLTLDFSAADVVRAELSGPCVSVSFVDPPAAMPLRARLHTRDCSVIQWPRNVLWPSGTAPHVKPGTTIILGMLYDGGRPDRVHIADGLYIRPGAPTGPGPVEGRYYAAWCDVS